MDALELKVEVLLEKIKQYLVKTMGVLPQDASDRAIFQALCYTLREEVMVHWVATRRTLEKERVRKIYYVSMEYLPGRMLSNNITNLHAHELISKVLKRLNKDYASIVLKEPDPGLGNGGLGRLASCLLDALATQRYPAFGYGLRYQYGVFQQEIWDGVQIEKPDFWLLCEEPWEMRCDGCAKMVKFGGIIKKRMNDRQESIFDLYDYEEVRALPFDAPIIGYSEVNNFNVVTLRLWSTKESPHNFQLQRYNAGLIGPAAENTALTDVLYPNDNHETGKRIRLKQEFLLVSASLQDIVARHLALYSDLTSFADKVRIQINDTHPALMVAELMRILVKEHQFTKMQAFEATQEVLGYTNHTIMSEALEEWNQIRLSNLLPRQYLIIEELNQQFCHKIREDFHDEEKVRRMSIIEGGQVRMAHLAILGSHKVNGVANLHGEILKHRVFKDFYEMFPDKFTSITNGISQRHWLLNCNPLLTQFIIECIGKQWLTDFTTFKNLGAFASDPASQKMFNEIKKHNKQRLMEFIYNENPFRDLFGNPLQEKITIEIDSLFDVHIKRFHEYKRQLMNVLNLIMIYHDLLDDVHSRKIKRTAFFSGKAAAGYVIAKYIIQLIHCVARKINHDPAIQGKLKIIFIQDYSVSKAELLIPAAELSEQISTVGTEASGTGNMKLAMNGALTIGTEDGANIEMREAIGNRWWPFSFGASSYEEQQTQSHHGYNPWDIYSLDAKIKQTLDSLRNGFFAQNESENEALNAVFDSLMLGFGGQVPDRFFVLKDLRDYYETQKKVEELYKDQSAWAEYALHNMAGMSRFSADEAVKRYAKEIWNIHPCPLDPQIYTTVRSEYQDGHSKESIF